MNVKQLLEELSKYDENMPVMLYSEAAGDLDIEGVEESAVKGKFVRLY